MPHPCPGQMVEVEYIEIDEIEVICLIADYGVLGYLSNSKMRIKPEHLNDTAVLKVSHIDESGYITLIPVCYYLD